MSLLVYLCCSRFVCMSLFFFKQNTAYEMRISDWSSDVCSSDLFAAQDLFLFYIFFEAGLIPMYLIIGIWGGARCIYASYKFFLYTLDRKSTRLNSSH